MQNYRGFKKYQFWKTFIFCQLVRKISNYATIRRNNVFTPPQKKTYFKTISSEKSKI